MDTTASFNPNSHMVGHIGSTLFLKQIAKKNSKGKNIYKG
jgi:hypothetical protein